MTETSNCWWLVLAENTNVHLKSTGKRTLALLNPWLLMCECIRVDEHTRKEPQCVFSYQRKYQSCWIPEETRDKINYRLHCIVPGELSWGRVLLLYTNTVNLSSCLNECRLLVGKIEKQMWDERTGKWSSLPRETEDVWRSILGFSESIMTCNIET